MSGRIWSVGWEMSSCCNHLLKSLSVPILTIRRLCPELQLQPWNGAVNGTNMMTVWTKPVRNSWLLPDFRPESAVNVETLWLVCGILRDWIVAYYVIVDHFPESTNWTAVLRSMKFNQPPNIKDRWSDRLREEFSVRSQRHWYFKHDQRIWDTPIVAMKMMIMIIIFKISYDMIMTYVTLC